MTEAPTNDGLDLAINSFDAKHYDKALVLCEQFLKGNPTNLKALRLLGTLYEEMNDLNQALSCCAAILLVKPESADILATQGILLAKQMKYEEALSSFKASLMIRPDNVKTLNNYGLTLIKLKKPEDAIHYFDKAISLPSDNNEAFINKGFTLLELHRYQEALDSYEKAFTIDASFAEAISDRGNALLGLKRYDEALASYAWALSVKPDCNLAHYSEAYVRLLMGDLTNGWPKYEYRWEVTQPFSKRNFHQPLWLGDISLAGKKLLVHVEQGHGDAIQFARYIPMLMNLGATIYLDAYPSLQSILEPLVKPGHFIISGYPLPEFDYYCPLLSLPLAFKTTMETIPNQVPYLSAPKTSLHQKLLLPQTNKPRIGIVWQANYSNEPMRFRSIMLELFLQITSNDYSFVIIQKEISDADNALLASQSNLIDMHEHINDFGDTATIINQLDLVISVDTSVAHLAGALGKPVWILLCANADWRWFIDRDDSPWYPSATLFRQSAFGCWDDVIDHVKQSLITFKPA